MVDIRGGPSGKRPNTGGMQPGLQEPLGKKILCQPGLSRQSCREVKARGTCNLWIR